MSEPKPVAETPSATPEAERWQPVPVPQGDGRHDIGDDVRVAIVKRLTSDWSRDPDLTAEKVRQLAMWAGASIRALLHELGTLRDFAGDSSAEPSLQTRLYQRASEIGPTRGGTEKLLREAAAELTRLRASLETLQEERDALRAKKV